MNPIKAAAKKIVEKTIAYKMLQMIEKNPKKMPLQKEITCFKKYEDTQKCVFCFIDGSVLITCPGSASILSTECIADMIALLHPFNKELKKHLPSEQKI